MLYSFLCAPRAGDGITMRSEQGTATATITFRFCPTLISLSLPLFLGSPRVQIQLPHDAQRTFYIVCVDASSGVDEHKIN